MKPETAPLATHLDQLARAARGDARALAAVACVAADRGLMDRAWQFAADARALAPEDGEIAARTGAILAARVPQWHFEILRDDRRHAVYDAALRRAVGPESRVLDIGAGSGLLALMAARAGAAAVTSCEMNRRVARAAAEIVARNGLDDRVHIVPLHSDAIDADRDMGGRADVIVSEIVSNNLIGEGALPVMADIVPRLLAPGGRVIPSGGAIRVALAYLEGGLPALQVDGFDLSPFAQLRQTPVHLSSASPRLALRSDAATLFAFDFASGGPWRDGRASAELSATGGPVNGIVQWIRLDLDDEVSYENDPGSPHSAWAVLFHPLPAEIDLAPGARFGIAGAHDAKRVWIWPES